MCKVKCIVETTSSVVIQKLLLTLKEQFLITTDQVEEKVDTVGYLEDLSSAGDPVEEGSSSGGDSEETDPRVQQEVGEIA